MARKTVAEQLAGVIPRPSARRALRSRADTALRGLLGRGLARANRRLVARAYAAAAWRHQRGLTAPVHHRHARYAGKPVVLNPGMIRWIAGQRPKTAEEAQYGQA